MTGLLNLWKSFNFGFKNHKVRAIKHVFLAYSVLWTLIESITSILSYDDIKGVPYYLTLVIVSFLYGIIKIFQPRSIEFKIPSSDTKVKIFYGDIFSQNGIIAIPVNEYFDSEIGKPVSENSLHGMLIRNYLGGYAISFDQAVQSDLSTANGQEVIEKVDGKNKKYPIGTTVLITANDSKFLLFAFSHTDPINCKAYADISVMTKSLSGLFEKARNILGGNPINIPLIGSGLSGVGLPTTQLLQLILLALVEETKKREISKEIRIVLHEARFEEIDLELIQKQWSN
jgi:hypothetical protein